ncbi:hypothetical protein J2D73_11525 [Acetobacter sacchari]|uniref:Uncharacterized protein n=1 Tax=Acetobacter sacchari TaxID=2661687 RepID=A0ABS3LWZ0_9PROT|nr:hypothetical protein [Acetobacter sacchari]MBO1360417.1 hypothetical protein [Acetobacter sacchari]
MGLQIQLPRLEITVRALAGDKEQRYQAACGVVHEHQQRAGRALGTKPAVLRPVDLHQLAQTLPTDPL